MRRLAMLLVLALFIACEGATGPPGPEGPTGPQGPQGEQGQDGQDGQDGVDGATVHIVRTGQLNAQGAATVELPPEAGTISDPPAITCWTAEQPGGFYFQIATAGGSACTLLAGPSSLVVGIVDIPGWYYLIVAVK